MPPSARAKFLGSRSKSLFSHALDSAVFLELAARMRGLSDLEALVPLGSEDAGAEQVGNAVGICRTGRNQRHRAVNQDLPHRCDLPICMWGQRVPSRQVAV